MLEDAMIPNFLQHESRELSKYFGTLSIVPWSSSARQRNPQTVVARAGYVKEMVWVAGVEPAWTCAQDMWVAATLHPELKRGPCSPLLFSPSRRPPGATCVPRPPDR